MPRVRSRRTKGPAGPYVRPEEELELILGPHPTRGSVFASPARRREAAAALRELNGLRSAQADALAAFVVKLGHRRGQMSWTYPAADAFFADAVGYLRTARAFLDDWLAAGRPALPVSDVPRYLP